MHMTTLCFTRRAFDIAEDSAPGLALRALAERFMRFVEINDDGHWIWTGRGGGPYGQFSVADRNLSAHRVAYELFVGPIPEGLEIDHGCKLTRCVNPEHLEPVTKRENVHRSGNPAGLNARKTHCQYGHRFSAKNTATTKRGTRRCRACARRRAREAWRASR